jgi:hypothetical protein
MDVGTATVIYDGPAGSASGDTFIRFVPNIITDEIIEINQFQGGGFYGYN